MIPITFALLCLALSIVSAVCGYLYASEPIPAYAIAVLFAVAACLFVAQALSERQEYSVPSSPK